MAGKNIPGGLVTTWAVLKEPRRTQRAEPAAEPKERRLKLCSQCRKSKVKCDGSDGDYKNPCGRCVKNNLECYYEYKVSSYKNTREPGVTVKKLGAEVDKKRPREDEDHETVKRSKLDSLMDIITLEECLELFDYFNVHLLSQLFGFMLLKTVKIKDLYESNSVLAITVCYIGSIHHLKLNSYTTTLKTLFDRRIFELLLRHEPRDDFDAFNTILSMCLIGFWLNRNFTGMAVQLAKNSGLNLNTESQIPSSDKIKLWYLLYTLDGQQALAYNREPIITKQDFSVQKIKRKLLQERSSSLYQDVRLISQIEYNTIVNDVFQGNSWDVLNPSNFGIPFRTNMDLDRWMVHWTVLFGSITGFDTNAWSSKSTLIYYNFAKMHINSSFIRNLMGSNEILLPWKNIDEISLPINNRLKELPDDSDEDNDDDDEDEELYITETDPIISSKIATTSAMNILQLFLFDNDIMESIRFCPTHIHVLLYYAVLIALNSPSMTKNDYTDYFKLIKLLKNLLKILSINLPIDKEFGLKLVFHLKKAMIENFEKHINSGELTKDQESKLVKELGILKSNSHIVENYSNEELYDVLDTTSGGRKTISAWPGTDHSHPVVNNTQIIEFSS